MSKQIRVEDEVYEKLEAFRDKRETFSDAVSRLLELREGVNRLLDVLEGQIRFKERQREALERQETVIR